MKVPAADAIPTGAVMARAFSLHVAYDTERFPPDGKPARLFADWERRIHPPDMPKAFPEEVNVRTKNCFPNGQLKDIGAISVHVLDAKKDDLFEVSILAAQTVLWQRKIPVAKITKTRAILNFYKGRKRLPEGEMIRMLPLEQFEVRVFPLKAKYYETGADVQVRLYGPFLVQSV